MTGPENSRHPLNQSDATDHDRSRLGRPRFPALWAVWALPRTIRCQIITNRASNFLLVFSLRPHLLCDYLVFFLIGQRDHFGFSFTTLTKNVLKQPIRTAVSDVNDQLECESYARNPKRARGKRYWFCIG